MKLKKELKAKTIKQRKIIHFIHFRFLIKSRMFFHFLDNLLKINK